MRALRLAPGRREVPFRRLQCVLGALLALGATRASYAAAGPKEHAISTEEVISWLDSKSDPALVADQGETEDLPAPPPPPRHHGVVVETGIGAFGQIGEMKHVSPIAPWFHLQLGYEPLRFLMVFAEGDLVLSNTSYAHPPPPARTYALWGVGAGLRGTVQAGSRVALYAQGSLGYASVSDDVLGIYGYRDADRMNLYLAGELGLEWYQVSPHFALALHGGLRDYTATFKRELSSQPPLAWVSGLSVRYTF